MNTLEAQHIPLAYGAVRSGSTRHEHTREHYNDKDRGTAIGAVVGFAVGVYLSFYTAPAAAGVGGPGAGVAAVVATIGGGMAIGAGLGGAIGTIVGEDGEESPPSSQDSGQGDPGGAIGVGPFGRGGEGQGDSGGGEGDGGGCFVAGTPVLLADGRRVPIETVQIGDLLASRSASRDPLQPQPATELFTHHVKDTLLLHLSNGSTLHTTRQHRFFVPDLGFVPAGRLTPGAILLTHDGLSLSVLGSSPQLGPAIVYNLEIATHHTFFVGDEGVWVHNVKPEEGDGDTSGGDGEP